MNELLMALCILGAASAVTLIWAEYRRRAHQLLAMQRMRSSSMYADLYTLVAYVRDRDLDEVRIERDRVIFFGMFPPGRLSEFRLSTGGYRYLSPRRIQALAQVLAMDIPQLQSARDYRLRHFRVMRPNGMTDDAYAFIARSAYKSRVLSARRHVSLDRL